MSNTRADILFIGTGAMGAPMARQLATAGYALILCDADTGRAAQLADVLRVRSVPAAQVAGVVADVRTVVLMLPSSAIVESVLGDGSEGSLLAALAPGTVVIDMSSSKPESTRRLAAEAEARGLGYIDAPVSGGVPKARTGELAIMVGGRADAVESRRPILEALGTVVTHVGDYGAGHALKALNNLLSAIGLVAAGEVLAMATAFGIDTRVALDVINGSTGRNQATEVKYGRYVLSGAFDSGFAMSLMVKDLRTALEIAHDSAVPVPISASTFEEWLAALSSLGARADHTEIAAYVERRAGLELRDHAS